MEITRVHYFKNKQGEPKPAMTTTAASRKVVLQKSKSVHGNVERYYT